MGCDRDATRRAADHRDLPPIATRLGVPPTTAIYLYGCEDSGDRPCGVRRAIIATLGLAGPRVTELCDLDNQDIVLSKARFHIGDAKTSAGVRGVDIHPRLLAELSSYNAGRTRADMDAPAFPTRVGSRRNRDNVLKRVVAPSLQRANELRAMRDEPPVRVHLTPHTFRRTYITFMIAAGFDPPYIQAQVGHLDATTTLAIYAQVIARPDRDQLRDGMRALLGIESRSVASQVRGVSPELSPPEHGPRPKNWPQLAPTGLKPTL
jgi:integrase